MVEEKEIQDDQDDDNQNHPPDPIVIPVRLDQVGILDLNMFTTGQGF